MPTPPLSPVDVESYRAVVYKSPRWFLGLSFVLVLSGLYMLAVQVGARMQILPWQDMKPYPPLSPLVLCLVIGLFGLWIRGVKATVTLHGIVYSRLLVMARISWEDIESVRLPYPGGVTVIATRERRYRLPWALKNSAHVPFATDLERMLRHYRPDALTDCISRSAKGQQDDGIQVYRAHPALPVLGIVSTLFWVYVGLLAGGWVDWAVFAALREFDLSETPTCVLLAVLLGGSLFLVATARCRLTLTQRDMTYRGLVRTVQIAWRDVVRVRQSQHLERISVWTPQSHVTVHDAFDRGCKLAIIRSVRAAAPDAVITAGRA